MIKLRVGSKDVIFLCSGFIFGNDESFRNRPNFKDFDNDVMWLGYIWLPGNEDDDTNIIMT